jgi:hypothetical protein
VQRGKEKGRGRGRERERESKREVGQDQEVFLGTSVFASLSNFFLLRKSACSRCDSGDEMLPLQGFKCEAKIPCRFAGDQSEALSNKGENRYHEKKKISEDMIHRNAHRSKFEDALRPDNLCLIGGSIHALLFWPFSR